MNNELNDILLKRLKDYSITMQEDELRATHEITQELVLYSLAKTSFFEQGLFQGGTSLRILFGINRYSEDLDFSLIKPDQQFQWRPYLQQIKENMAQYGCNLEVQDRSNADDAIKKAFIKDTSIGQILNFSWAMRSSNPQKIRIKLEIDSNPPLGSTIMIKNLNYPFPYSIKTQDLPSLFAGKCHALLCREYTKGRDWYDFLWYSKQNVEPNYKYLSNALNQTGPFAGRHIKANRSWLEDALREKINHIDINSAKTDVLKFINLQAADDVNRWDRTTFLTTIDEFHKNCIESDEKNPLGSFKH
ncbi:conserved hypothetical protein [Treponema primitia ZAS-2]|uniref:Nucleotidyl transferase AbiEii/AbiGii toxin family protein n=1 Tax=Treponema primitia (strain ATCC BAA-887 / DSM 12427 / ZAS-2) TaxID=545694 RepID=F5YNQ8_TREPZ|nr:nucleotidyl transferase AbiEii/AbiGii toxin family protein [Treponema primitia]AEF86143.1 conserved hypothetical protein [Treponema primitia ZAS-2]